MFNLFPLWKDDEMAPRVSIVGCSHGDHPEQTTVNDQPVHIGHFMIQTEAEVIVGHIDVLDNWLPDRVATAYAQGRIDTIEEAPSIPEGGMVIAYDDLPEKLKAQFPRPPEAGGDNISTDEDDDDLHTGQYL